MIMLMAFSVNERLWTSVPVLQKMINMYLPIAIIWTCMEVCAIQQVTANPFQLYIY